MSDCELMNREAVKKIVKNHFDLYKDSLDLFNERIENPNIAKEYKDILNGSSDLRIRKPVSFKLMEDFDDSWEKFLNLFNTFGDITNIKYEDYSNNNIKIGKNVMKLKNALISFYLNLMNDYTTISKLTRSCSYNRLYNNCEIFSDKNGVIIIESASNRNHCRYDLSLIGSYLNDDNFKRLIAEKKFVLSDEARNKIESFITEEFQKISMKKPTKGKMQVVLSCNFADWFLCSTGESWSSCISLESKNEQSYWVGLPGIIGDINRAMIYITDGTKKKYNGISVDRFLYRAWLFTIRKKGDKEQNTKFYCPATYPNEDINIVELAEKAFGIKILDSINTEETEEDYVSKYYLDLFYHNKVSNSRHNRKFTTAIYNDCVDVRMAKKNVAKNNFGKYAYFAVGSSGPKRFLDDGTYIDDGETGFNCDRGLTYLIKKNRKVTEFTFIDGDNCRGEDDEEFDEDEE